MSKTNQLTIDAETGDRITVISLKAHRAYLKKDLTQWRENPRSESNATGYWIHPDDVVLNMRMIEALDLVIEYFGEP